MNIKVDLETKLSAEERAELNRELPGLVLEVHAAVEMQRKGEPEELPVVLEEVFTACRGLNAEQVAAALSSGERFELLVKLAKSATLCVRAHVKQKRARAADVAEKVLRGVATKSVECEERQDFPRGQVTTVRSDPRELWPEEFVAKDGVVEVRAMTREEHQVPSEALGAKSNVVKLPKQDGARKGEKQPGAEH